jgi:hypothetical protein
VIITATTLVHVTGLRAATLLRPMVAARLPSTTGQA